MYGNIGIKAWICGGKNSSGKLVHSNLSVGNMSSGEVKIIRLPLIPGHNLDDDNIKATAEFISGLDNIVEVNLMPCVIG